MDERKNPRTTETEDDEQTWEQEGGKTERPRADEDDTTRTKTRPDMPQPQQKQDQKPGQHKPQQTPEKKK